MTGRCKQCGHGLYQQLWVLVGAATGVVARVGAVLSISLSEVQGLAWLVCVLPCLQMPRLHDGVSGLVAVPIHVLLKQSPSVNGDRETHFT